MKLKYELLHSTLTESKIRSGTSLGPLGPITFELIYQGSTVYAVYMLAFFG